MASEQGGFPPIVVATFQSCVLAATSNIMAQTLTAYRANEALIVDWVPVVQFIVWTVANTPYNYLWQEYLEQTFPAFDEPPKDADASKGGRKGPSAPAGEPKLNVRNTLVKTVLDQTIGAAVNTFLFALFMNALKAAMARPDGAGFHGAENSLAFLASGSAVDYSRVDWGAILAKVRAEFFPIIAAGWRLWPLVSLVNFAFIKSVQGRNLVGSLAGVGWGIYMSLFSAEN